MARNIKNKQELDSWIFKQLEAGHSVVSIRSGNVFDDFFDPLDETTTKLPLNTEWKNVMTGEVFHIEYEDET